jgi:hypothetical protein
LTFSEQPSRPSTWGPPLQIEAPDWDAEEREEAVRERERQFANARALLDEAGK